MAKNKAPFRIGIIPINGFALMSYAATVEPLRAANLLNGSDLYETTNIQVDATPAQSSGLALVPPQILLKDVPEFDLVLLVAGSNATGYKNPKLASWLRNVARAGTVIGGVSAGPVFLAQNGLLLNRRMTVHWEHADFLQENTPDALLERSLYVIDRDRMTCGGGTAPMDLMLALIANQHGQKLAQQVGDWFLHTAIRPPTGPQRAGLSQRYDTTSIPVLAAIKAIETHIANPLTLPQLAKIAGASPRQLSRLFTTAVGETPMAFGRQIRLEKARSLLANAPLSVSEVALMTGFSSAAHFSTAYSKQYGAPPSAARR